MRMEAPFIAVMSPTLPDQASPRPPKLLTETAKAFFWVKPLAAMPRFALRAARADVIQRMK
jgi:hypothetical protein